MIGLFIDLFPNASSVDPYEVTKIIKIVATRWRILRLKCTKFDFGWGSAPDPAGGAYSAPPDPLAAGFGGPTSKEREREGTGGRGGERKGGEGREGRKDRGGEGRAGEERGREETEGEGKERAMSPPTIWRKFTPMAVDLRDTLSLSYWTRS